MDDRNEDKECLRQSQDEVLKGKVVQDSPLLVSAEDKVEFSGVNDLVNIVASKDNYEFRMKKTRALCCIPSYKFTRNTVGDADGKSSSSKTIIPS